VSYAKIKGTEWQVRKPRKWKAGGTPLFKDEVKDKDREMTKEEQDLEKKRRNTMTEAEVIFSKGEFVAGRESITFAIFCFGCDVTLKLLLRIIAIVLYVGTPESKFVVGVPILFTPSTRKLLYLE
jgi:hypothetical protein